VPAGVSKRRQRGQCRAVDGDEQPARQPAAVQHLGADQPSDHLRLEAGDLAGAHVVDEQMADGVVHRQAVLAGPGQPVEVVEQGAFQLPQVEIDLAAAAQFAGERQQALPDQELPGVDDHREETGVSEARQPRRQPGPQVPHQAHEAGAQCYDLPFRRRLCVV